MSPEHAENGGDSNLFVNEAATALGKTERDRAFWKVWLLTILLGVVLLVVVLPFLGAYIDNERRAEGAAAAAAYLAELPTPAGFEAVDPEMAPPSIRLPGTGDDVVRANQVVAYQTLAATYSSKASDNQEWAIFVLSAGVLSIIVVYIRAFRSFVGLTFSDWWAERRVKRDRKKTINSQPARCANFGMNEARPILIGIPTMTREPLPSVIDPKGDWYGTNANSLNY